MFDQQYADSQLSVEFGEQRKKIFPCDWVQLTAGLVQQQDPRLHGDDRSQ